MDQSYEILEHTADVGLRAWGRDLPELYANAARGLFSLLAATEKVRTQETITVDAEGHDAVDLLVRWLHELLYYFEVKRLVFRDVKIESFEKWRLRATVECEPLDLERHELSQEIKAVTYHGASVQKTDGGWQAEALLDI